MNRRTKGNLAYNFHSFCRMLKLGFLQEFSRFDGNEWPIKAG